MDVKNKMNQKQVVSNECFSMKISNDPTLLLITSKKNACEEEFVIVNTLGENVFQESDLPSNEMKLHLLIYQQLNVNCVLQINTVNSSIVSNLLNEHREFYLPQENKSVPMIENENEILQFISEQNVVFIKNRGIVAWGDELEEVSQMLQKVVFQCEYQLKLMMIESNRTVT